MNQPLLPDRDDEQVPPHIALVRRVEPLALTSWARIILAGALALALGLGFLQLFEIVARPLGLLFLGLVIAMALHPYVELLGQRLPWLLAVLSPYVLILVLAASAVFVTIPDLVAQAGEALARLPELTAAVWGWLEGQDAVDDEQVVQAVLAGIDRTLGAVTFLPFTLASAAVEVITVLFMSVYWLLALPKLGEYVLSLVPEERRAGLTEVLAAMGHTMGGYVRGVVINCVVIGACAYIGLTFFDVRFPLVLAIMAGVLEAVPYLGPIVAGAVVTGVALLDSPTQAALILAYWVALQQLENNLLVPYVMRRQADIPALLVLVAVITGISAGGVLGALIAIPLSGAAMVFVRRVVTPLVRRSTGATAVEIEVATPPAA